MGICSSSNFYKSYTYKRYHVYKVKYKEPKKLSPK